MVIPKPAIQEERPGAFRLSPETRVYLAKGHDDRHARWVGEQLAQRLGFKACGCEWLGSLNRSAAPVGSIIIVIDPEAQDLGSEGYTLSIEQDLITICASRSEGAFYAAESLIQLAPPPSDEHGNGKERRIACVRIEDQPRFGWRGFMLDSARHYQDIALIKIWIDRMASLKLNRFHWHLTDDEAWRIQIDKYPRLTEVAAWRFEGGQRYGGYYTKEQAREVVTYAKDRGITVIPEIEMPGHCNAAIYAYPHLSCSGRPLTIGKEGWNAYTQVDGRMSFCVGRDETLTFIQDVLREVAEFFDTPYIHIGGDERPAGVWSECPHCRQRMKLEAVANEDELHVWFMSHIATFAKQQLGRQPIGWAEKLDVGIPENQIIQGWHPGQSAKALGDGRCVINSTHEWVYLDYPWSASGQSDKPDWMPVLPLSKVYEFDPTHEAGLPADTERLLGGEAPAWTEYIETPEKLQDHVMPRLAALSEALWTPRVAKNFNDFEQRLRHYQGESKQITGPVIFADLAMRGPKAATQR